MALDPTALFNLSYGLYVLTAREDGRDCGCIVNTVTQLTENPTRIALSVNKQNFTNEVIQRTGVFNISVLTEAAIFAEKIAVAEETVRLGSHVHQFRQILSSSEPVGRKLDFLVQEMNREVNTIGSKAQDVAIARLVVDMKAEIEKIREQIQNIE